MSDDVLYKPISTADVHRFRIYGGQLPGCVATPFYTDKGSMFDLNQPSGLRSSGQDDLQKYEPYVSPSGWDWQQHGIG